MADELQKFIEDNIDLIDQNTKESWEELYSKLVTELETSQFTEVMLEAGIDPAEILGYIPRRYLWGSKIENYEIPRNVISIGKDAFESCNFTSIEIPDGVTEIGYGAFGFCRRLTSVIMKGNVTTINTSAFFGCTSLTDVVIPSSVTEIGWEAFYGCSSLTSVVIPSSVTTIGDEAFRDCINLRQIMIKATQLNSIGYDIFRNCPKLRAIHYDGPMSPELAKLKGFRKALKIICTDGVM